MSKVETELVEPPTPSIRYGPRARREAAMFEWAELTLLQRRAVLACHKRLIEIAKMRYTASAPRTGAGRFLPSLDEERLNNAVLIDGRRGSGKTAVLFTLLRYWMGRMPEMAEFLSKEETKQERDRNLAVEIEKRLGVEATAEAAKSTIVPIGPIDLQYLAPTTQIIPLIAGAFNEVLEAIREVRGLGHESDRIESPWMTLPSESVARTVDLHHEFVDSASAWEIDISERHHRLDPEDYAIELATMESKRSKLQKRFRAFADALYAEFVSTFRSTGRAAPLFVLCIDDADMKPRVSTRLLEALRVLYHPRIAFMLTGDTELFVNMLSDAFLANLRSPFRRIDLQADKEDEANDRSYALLLAREVYDKIVPTSHRVTVSAMPPRERRHMLQEVIAHIRPTSEDAGRKRGFVDWYLKYDLYTRNALPSQLRDMLSLNDFVSEWHERAKSSFAAADGMTLTSVEPSALPISVIQKLWVDALSDALLRRADQELLREVVRYETHPYFRFFVDNSMLRKNTLSVPLRTLSLRDQSTLSLRQIVGYEMYMHYGERDVAVLSSAAEGALILATDLAADDENGDFVAPSLSPDEFDNPFVTVGQPLEGMTGIIDIVWPLPDWDSFVDFHLFSTAWTAIVTRERNQTEGMIERLALRFVWLVTQMVDENFVGLEYASDPTDVVSFTGQQGRSFDLSSLDWPNVAEEVVRMIDLGKGSRQKIMARWAATRALLIAAPESKLPRRAARAFISYFRRLRGTEWLKMKRSIDDARIARILKSYVHVGKERGITVENGGADALRKVLDWPEDESVLQEGDAAPTEKAAAAYRRERQRSEVSRDEIAQVILWRIDQAAGKKDPWPFRHTKLTGTHK